MELLDLDVNAKKLTDVLPAMSGKKRALEFIGDKNNPDNLRVFASFLMVLNEGNTTLVTTLLSPWIAKFGKVDEALPMLAIAQGLTNEGIKSGAIDASALDADDKTSDN